MFNRLPQRPHHSFILLGPRGCGKSTWLRSVIKKNFLMIDLLDLKIQRILLRNPERLADIIDNRTKNIEWIIIDEIQKIPALLDTVHSYIEKTDLKFALSGSSARKLRKGAANLLAGRAFELRMYPFSYLELKKSFNLNQYLTWGGLPKIYSIKQKADKIDFLNTYSHLYIKEEIKEEQIVRKLDPFMDFLVVAAQMDTKIVNFSKIANDVGVDTATVISYFKILEDTFIGRYLPAYHTSVRKRQRQNPKFYFFDNGVRRALDGTIDDTVKESTSEYGRLFEQMVMNEFFKLNFYKKSFFDFSYINADNDSEIDLVIEKGRKVKFLVEIKSAKDLALTSATNLENYKKDFPDATYLCLSNDSKRVTRNGITYLHWQDGIKAVFARK